MHRTITALLAFALLGFTARVAAAPLHDTEVVADSTFARGSDASIHVVVRVAKSLRDSAPVAGAKVVVLLEDAGADGGPSVTELLSAETGTDGVVDGTFQVPLVDAGSYDLLVHTRSPYGEDTVRRAVVISDELLLHLRTDRGLYRPGQIVRYRITTLNGTNAHPLAGVEAKVAFLDPRGTKVWRGTAKTDETGMVTGELPLADDLLLGAYAVEAEAGGVVTRETVKVRAFELPPFVAQVTLDEGAGAVVARYLYGEPVAGDVQLTAYAGDRKLLETSGRTDPFGRLAFTLPPRQGTEGLRIEATVTDGAGRQRTASLSREGASHDLELVIVPEHDALQTGIEQAVTVVATDGAGEMVPADITLLSSGRVLGRDRESDGALRVGVTPPEPREKKGTSVRWADGFVSSVASTGTEGSLERIIEVLEGRAAAVGRCFPPFESDERWVQGNATLTLRSSAGKLRLVRLQDDRDSGVFPLDVSDLQVRRCVEDAFGSVSGRAAGKRGLYTAVLDVSYGFDDPESEPPDPEPLRLLARAVTKDGRKATVELEVPVTLEPVPRVVRVIEPVVEPGQTVQVEGVWPGSEGALVATLLRRGAPVASATATRGPDGHLRASLVAPAGVFGLATVRLAEPAWSLDETPFARTAEASVYLLPTRLDVRLDAETRHRPGEDATVRVRVTDPDGRPLEGVGLAASAVDERVLALSPPRPSLAAVLRMSDIGGAGEAGIELLDLLDREQPTAAERLLVRAIIDALPPAMIEPWVHLPGAERFLAEHERLTGLEEPLVTGLVQTPGAVFEARSGETRLLVSAAAALERSGWTQADCLTPWGDPLSIEYLRELNPGLDLETLALTTGWLRMEAVADLVLNRSIDFGNYSVPPAVALEHLLASEEIPEHLRTDAWGQPWLVRAARRGLRLDLVSKGADGLLGTRDDLVTYGVFGTEVLGLVRGRGYGGLGSRGVGVGGGGVAHAHGSGHASVLRAPGPMQVAIRKRFDETVLWAAGIRTDAQGFANLDVPLADSITGFEVAVEALSPLGAVGGGKTRLETFLPLHVDADLPDELTLGDRYTATAVVANHSGREQVLTVTLTARDGVALDGPGRREVTVPDGATTAVHFPLRAEAVGDGEVKLELASTEGPVDAVLRPLRVEPAGRKETLLVTGAVEEGQGALDLTVPATFAPGTLKGRLRLFRGPVDQAIDGLEGMLREPHGCFEQTSSTTFPNLLVLQLLQGRKGMAETRKRAKELVGLGYQRLLSYEVTGGGFSWFGESPANQVLTAYGLVEFADMAEVYPTDPDVVARTRRWLASKQNEDGSFTPDAHWLHDWSAVQGNVSTTAYIAWALAESGAAGGELDRALGFLRANRPELEKSPYLLSLWAAAEAAAGATPEVPLSLLERFARRDGEKLRFEAVGQTMLYGAGSAANVEVTALFARAALSHAGASESDRLSALTWIWDARRPSFGWGTTQATVLALRAMALGADGSSPDKGVLRVAVDGAQVAEVDLAAEGLPTVDLPALSAGAHHVSVEGDAAGKLLADLRAQWRSTAEPLPVSAGLDVGLEASPEPVSVGRSKTMTLTIHNPGDRVVAMPTATVPVPPGFRPDVQRLRRLVERAKIARYDDQGREIHLYLTQLAPGATVTLEYALEATAACDVTQRGARAYAYYDPATQGLSGSLRLAAGPREIAAR